MSVMKEDGTRRLIQQILASLKVGKIAIMDKVLNINSSNPVENKVITQAINGINNKIEDYDYKPFMFQGGQSQQDGKIMCYCNVEKRTGIDANGSVVISLGALPSSIVPYQAGVNVEDTDLTIWANLRTEDAISNINSVFIQSAFIERDTSNQKYLIKLRLHNLSNTQLSSTTEFKFDIMVIYNDWNKREHNN